MSFQEFILAVLEPKFTREDPCITPKLEPVIVTVVPGEPKIGESSSICGMASGLVVGDGVGTAVVIDVGVGVVGLVGVWVGFGVVGIASL